MPNEPFQIRPATASDLDQIIELLPRLAGFELPAGRDPDDLWRQDAALVRAWAAGESPGCLIHVAVNAGARIVGLVVTSLRPEILSHAPSAHLEAIAVASDCEGQGIAASLIEITEAAACERGALSMTLHVFSTNERARRVYQRSGYDEEIIRCTKPL